MDIYAPLAERIGMYEIMNEMQTLAFRELEPDAYASITRRLKQLHEQGGDLVSRIGLGLQLYLADHGLEAEVTGREKHPFSIWKKMAERHISFEQLSDVMAFRVIVDDVDECYRALGLIHQRWPMVPGRFKDYHLDPQAQRLPVAAHLGHPRLEDADRNPDPRPRDARPGRARARRPLGLQGRQARRRPAGPLDRRPGRDPRPCRQPRRAARAHPDGDVPGPDLRLHPEGRADPAAQGRDPGRLRLCRPHRPWRPDGRRQGQRPGGAAAHHPGEWRPGRNPRLRGAAPAAVWLRFVVTGKARAGDPPLRPPQGTRRDDRARPQDLRRDRRPAARRRSRPRRSSGAQEAEDRG